MQHHQYYLPKALESFQNPDHENIHIAWSLLGRENLEEEGLGTPPRSLVGPILSSQLPKRCYQTIDHRLVPNNYTPSRPAQAPPQIPYYQRDSSLP